MRLVKLKCEGFRSLSKVEVNFNSLTVLIGENDAGKSSILDLLEICLGNGRPDENDFCQDENGIQSESIRIVAEFALDVDDNDARPYAINGVLTVRNEFELDGSSTTSYLAEVPEDKRLAIDDFEKMSASDQKTLIRALDPDADLSELSNKSKRAEWLQAKAADAPKVAKWVEAPRRWGDFLPRFERYSAMDYDDPANMVLKTLKQIYEASIFEEHPQEDGGTSRTLIKPLQDIQERATRRINDEISELREGIRRYNPRVKDIGFDPIFDFSNSLRTGEFQVDFGRGFNTLSKTGDGTKRRMFMAILDWDREISVEQVESGASLPSIIRGYDEPDTNLHYGAQRAMYQAIADIVNTNKSPFQAVLCTHSLTMIDRAPAQSIRMLTLDDVRRTHISQLETEDDPEVEKFLTDLAREMGITNSLIFYERCFILIEGETEENALPIIYKKLFGRSLFEDGIRLINVRGNGAVREFLKFLSRNRKEVTVICVDSDIKDDRGAKLTEDILRQSGFDEEFIQARMYYAGDAEFEDMFDDEILAAALQHGWPRTPDPWQPEEIDELRGNSKFSSGIQRLVADCPTAGGDYLRKPEFGIAIAECCPQEKVPDTIKELFETARKIVAN